MKLKVLVPPPGEEELRLNYIYLIKEVREFTSELKGYKGVRVLLQGEKKEMVSIPLWYRDIVGRRSKLGSFVLVLGDDLAGWIGKKIKFISWEKNKREIEVMK